MNTIWGYTENEIQNNALYHFNKNKFYFVVILGKVLSYPGFTANRAFSIPLGALVWPQVGTKHIWCYFPSTPLLLSNCQMQRIFGLKQFSFRCWFITNWLSSNYQCFQFSNCNIYVKVNGRVPPYFSGGFQTFWIK